MNFEREHFATWDSVMDKRYEAYKLWLQYEYICESYDQRMCTIFDEYGFAMPKTSEERRLMQAHSSRQRNYLLTMKEIFKINDDDWTSAKKEIGRLTCKGIKSEYNRIFGD